MLNPSPALLQFEARYEREAARSDSYESALRRFASLWRHACLLNPELGSDWLDDLAAARAIARALNGLAPAP
jgi:hypothetical protein